MVPVGHAYEWLVVVVSGLLFLGLYDKYCSDNRILVVVSGLPMAYTAAKVQAAVYRLLASIHAYNAHACAYAIY